MIDAFDPCISACVFHFSSHMLQKTTHLHHMFARFFFLSFHFFILLRSVAKKIRRHFCGVKWQKLWGILCFRASMIIPWKKTANRYFLNRITWVCSGILSLTHMGHSKWSLFKRQNRGWERANQRFWSFRVSDRCNRSNGASATPSAVKKKTPHLARCLKWKATPRLSSGYLNFDTQSFPWNHGSTPFTNQQGFIYNSIWYPLLVDRVIQLLYGLKSDGKDGLSKKQIAPLLSKWTNPWTITIRVLVLLSETPETTAASNRSQWWCHVNQEISGSSWKMVHWVVLLGEHSFSRHFFLAILMSLIKRCTRCVLLAG